MGRITLRLWPSRRRLPRGLGDLSIQKTTYLEVAHTDFWILVGNGNRCYDYWVQLTVRLLKRFLALFRQRMKCPAGYLNEGFVNPPIGQALATIRSGDNVSTGFVVHAKRDAVIVAEVELREITMQAGAPASFWVF